MPVSSGIRLSISDRLPHAPAIALARVEGSWAHTLNSLNRPYIGRRTLSCVMALSRRMIALRPECSRAHPCSPLTRSYAD